MIDIMVTLILVCIVLVLLGLSIRIVRPTERGLKERFGRYHSFMDQGLHILIPFIDKLVRVNITEQMVDAEPQEVITRDNLNAKVDAQVYFRVKQNEEAVKNSVYNVDNYYVQIVALARTTLRDIIGKMDFKEVNSQREVLNNKLGKELDAQTNAWGIQIVRTELKEIEPPEDVQNTMNKVLKAENEKIAAKDFATATETEADGQRRATIKVADGQKQARVLQAQGVAQAIKLENEAAQKYFKHQAVELKKLETLKDTLKRNTKIIVPQDAPIIDILAKMAALGEKPKK